MAKKSTPRAETRHPPNGASAAALGDPITIRSKLGLLGWPTITDWAAAHGYERRMASYCIRTWGNRADKRPHGGIARAVMQDLQKTIADGLRPEQVSAKG